MSEIENWVLRFLDGGGERYVKRLARKRTGGDSFSAGWRYELAYNAHIVIVELAKLLAAFRDGVDVQAIRACYIDQSPVRFVDDVEVKTLTDELLIQLKSGRIDWLSVVADFQIQNQIDNIKSRNVKYRLVNGSEKSLLELQNKLKEKGLPTAQAEIFHYPESFSAYLDHNESASSALAQLTGSSNRLDQETAYRALMYVIICHRNKISLVSLLNEASRTVYDFLTPLDKYDTYEEFECLLRKKFPDVAVRISGRLVHLEDAGFLQTFIVPSDQHRIDEFRDWLINQDDSPVDELHQALRLYRWNEVDRSRYDQRVG